MQLITCEHPRKIWCKATQEYRLVPCGHCNLCRNAHASKWVERLEQEAKSWKYVMFFTLTYDEQYCPRFTLGKDHSLTDISTGEYVDPSFYENLKPSEKKIVRLNKGIKCCCSQDIQLFMKRLRYYFTSICRPTYDANGKELKEEDPQVRYYCAGELSPTGYRPHYHGLLFFSSDRCAQNIDRIIGQSWKLGLFDCQAVQSSAAGYVARYSVGLNSLPSFYQFGKFKPKALFSKCPPLGSLAFTSKDYEEILFEGRTSLYLPKSDKVVSIPLYSWLKNRLFPKLQGFDCLTHLERVALYGVPKFYGFEEYEEFEEWYLECVHGMPNLVYKRVPDPCLPIVDVVTEKRINPLYLNLQSLYDRLNPDPFHSLRRYWHIAKRVCLQASIYNISVSRYVELIEQYYQNVRKDSLTHFYQEMIRQANQGRTIGHFIFADPLFVEVYAKFESFEQVPWWMMQTVDGYGIDPYRFWSDKLYRDSFNPINQPEYQDYKFKVDKIVSDEHKNKAKKEYLRLHPECRIS